MTGAAAWSNRRACAALTALLPADQAPHDRQGAPVIDYRCRQCGAVFNLFTGTLFQKTRYPCTHWSQVKVFRNLSRGWRMILGTNC